MESQHPKGGANFHTVHNRTIDNGSMANDLPHKLQNNLEYPASPQNWIGLKAEQTYNSWNIPGFSLTDSSFQSIEPAHLQTTFLRRTSNSSAMHPGLGAFEQSTCPLSTTVWLVGDSTVASGTGWGDAFGARFQWTPVKVENRALPGFSSKLFYQSTVWPNRTWKLPGTSPWESVLSGIRAGDYVFIQFGHNDKIGDELDNGTLFTYPGDEPDFHGTFRQYLELYIKKTRERGATPILVTPVSRMKWKDGAYVSTHGDFPAAMRKVAADNDVVLLDLEAKSSQDFLGRGETETLSLYAFPPNPENGKQGISHFPPEKAWRVAEMVAELLRKSASPLGTYTP